MAEGEDVEWELCKENIQPLRRGRNMSALLQALSHSKDGLNPAVLQQRQAFESELRLYDGDDPLDVWDRYIKWTEQMFPQGGKESNLSTLLEQAVTRYADETKYHNDARYVDLWIKYAGHCLERLDIYRYMKAQGIGTTRASFYIAWAEELENRGEFLKADLIFQEGFKMFAQPLDKLQQFHKLLQARVSRQAIKKVDDSDSDSDYEPRQPERVSLAELKTRGKKGIVPIVRTGPAIKSVPKGLSLRAGPIGERSCHASNTKLMIFDENKVSAGPSEPKFEPWLAPPPSRAKENEKKVEKWCDVKMRQKSAFGSTMVLPPLKPTFQPFVEESDETPKMTPCKIIPTVNNILSARKPHRDETPLKRLLEHHHQHKEGESGKELEKSMYCKELLFSGTTEFSLEELRAELYFKKKNSQAVSYLDKPATDPEMK
ncbi:mitotic checkpoint serine/threonine-protein kinase BUB1 beta [Corythoichthys intestinalis]|uniref:mitotic checkpoint serine/threonine-protein kinase BUB1 beta n=1 Tax=Corythoichthys intestinalis TaxID=161448 RepID=UPI0025A55755|nr:mitotic checkpoint serine/threonine-protein kinase BUB1 beta [Corythoichthys intestinalis]XP_057716114.1 mitotic checkpoint serine/threonine-protein kinase BUB1 beta [Corythoichthys intestinalis]XP_061798694.1 mitotic checkpoint serine/threonine-protein kinase BUB1 beta-like [Nerophis lumbriciformis]